MLKIVPLVAAGALLLPVTLAYAAAPAPHPTTMTCRDFLTLDNVERPKVVYWSEGLRQHGKPGDGVVDIVSTDRVIPILVEQCKSQPAASFLTKLDEAWRRFETDVKAHL